MNRRAPSRLPARALVSLAAAALSFGIRYDAFAYGNHRDKAGEGVLVSHAQGLPDLARGKQAAKAGRLEDAEADLKPLAERGYIEAQIALAKLYAQIGTPERVTQAIVWLRNAHDRSPLDTEVPLGRLLVRQNDDTSITEGEALLASGWDQHRDPDALAGLIRVYSEHPQLDTGHRLATLVTEAERIGTADVQGAVISWYRGTRHEDGHEQKLVSLCGRWVDQLTACYVDLARAERIAGHPGRLQALVTAASAKYDDGLVDAKTLALMARVLVARVDAGDDDDDDAPTTGVQLSDVKEDENELNDAAVQNVAAAMPQPQCTRIKLTPAVAASNANAAAAAPQDSAMVPAQPELANILLAKLLKGPDDAPVLAAGTVARYPYLLPNADIEASLRSGLDRGVPEAPLYLGELYLKGARVERDPVKALRYLQQAADQPQTALKAHYELGRLFADGYLDESRPLLAAQYLMWSARRGYTAADGALARLFVNGRGLCPDLANAYVFARLGARGGSASIAVLEQQIAARLPADARSQADGMYVAERDARPSSYRIPQTMLAQAAAIAAEHGVQMAASDTVEVSAGDNGAASTAASTPAPITPPAEIATSDASASAPLPVAPDEPVNVTDPVPASEATASVDAPSADATVSIIPPVAPTPPSNAPSRVSALPPDAADGSGTPMTGAPSDAHDGLSLQLSRRLRDAASPAALQPAATASSPTSPLVLSHRPSSDPALNALFGGDAQTDDPDVKARFESTKSMSDNAQVLEYVVPVQVPDAPPLAAPKSDSGDKS